MKSRLGSAITYSALVIFLAVYSTGCQQSTPPVEEPVTSEPVVVPKEEPVVKKVEPAPVQAAEEVVETESSSVTTTHTVQNGECLWTISESADIYDDPFQWPLIYKANRGQIKDPDLIYADQELDIPRDSSQSEIDDAVHEAKTRGPWSLWDGK
ncbi:MAG: LysM peptidoglycan-binding domain-containing protein [bacterium]|nr:LysM peptidoglycan-binding domain-containing protein [bacterium]